MPGVRKTSTPKYRPSEEKKETVADIRCKPVHQARTYTQVLQEGSPTNIDFMIWPELILEWNAHFKGLCRSQKRSLGLEYLEDHSLTYYGHLPLAEPSDLYLRTLPLIWGAPF